MRRAPVPARNATLAILRVVVAAGCWGLAAVIAKNAFESGVPPIRMAEARVVVALVVLAALLAWRRAFAPNTPQCTARKPCDQVALGALGGRSSGIDSRRVWLGRVWRSQA